MADILYKYLDIEGGKKMLKYSNLQFTNATKFNDPFDCDPALFDYSNIPVTKNNWPPDDFFRHKAESDMRNLRNETWMCCLSKVYDSLLMWAYYNNHKGVCIGLNKDAVMECLQHYFIGLINPYAAEVRYRDIHQRPDYFKNPSWAILLTTKAKEWEHEHEVRIITKEPNWIHARKDIPKEYYNDELVDGKEIRYYVPISKDCFDSIYLGVNMFHNKDEIINAAKELNPEIKIYQIKTDPEAFKLKEEKIS